MTATTWKCALALGLLLVAADLGAQNATAPERQESARPAYALGEEDQITIRAEEVDGLSSQPMRIGADGFINLPLVGRVKATGLTATELEQELVRRLSVYIKKPQVSVSVGEIRSQPVSVIGAVTSPGVQQLQGPRTLVEALSMAGGLRPDAGYSVRITRALERGRIPLATAKDDPSGQFSTAEVQLRDIMEAKNPQQNILILPNDVITVPKADMVYVIGDVVKAGGIVLAEQQTVSVLQALSIAAGLGKTAKPKDAKILRVRPGAPKREELAVNVKDILAGKKDDVPMQAEDILFVPSSGGKAVALRVMEAAIGTGVTAIIWRGTQ